MRFEDWIDADDLTPEERVRLERVHELLVEAGPPPALPTKLERPPAHMAQVIPFPRTVRRRMVLALVAAALLVAAAFAGGYLAGQGDGMHVVRTAALQSPGGGRAFASLDIGRRYESGNWPIEMTVRGLPQQPDSRAYYLLLLWSNGKPAGVCGAFRVDGGATKVHFDVPYRITPGTKWVITAITPGERYPGTVMMKTA